jgi:hypothetical protein
VLRVFLGLFITGALLAGTPLLQAAPDNADGRVKKVLPHLLDHKGRHTVSPSLFDRDAYQVRLRQNPEEVSGIRYDVHWKARGVDGAALTVRVELRGLYERKKPREATLEKTYEGKAAFREWTELELTGEAYAAFGKITAWRATLWAGDTLLDEYTSFLW